MQKQTRLCQTFSKILQGVCVCEAHSGKSNWLFWNFNGYLQKCLRVESESHTKTINNAFSIFFIFAFLHKKTMHKPLNNLYNRPDSSMGSLATLISPTWKGTMIQLSKQTVKIVLRPVSIGIFTTLIEIKESSCLVVC